MDWVLQWMDQFLDAEFPVCYFDKKLFYTVTRRCRIKFLPKCEHEEEGADFIVRPKTRSRRIPIKVMYLRVVGRPCADKGFNGRILLERVSEERTIQKQSKHQRFWL